MTGAADEPGASSGAPPAEPPAGAGRRGRRLGVQIGLLLGIVLLPFAAITTVAGLRFLGELRAGSQAMLLSSTRAATSDKLRMLQGARATSETLSRLLPLLRGDPAECSRAMRAINDAQPEFALAGYIGPDRKLGCSSLPAPVDLAGEAPLSERLAADKPAIFVNAPTRWSAEPLVALLQPVRDPDGRPLGMVLIALPQKTISAYANTAGSGPENVALLDGSGAVLSASALGGAGERWLPSPGTLGPYASGDATAIFSGASAGGVPSTYAVVPLVPGALYAVGTWPVAPGTDWERALVVVPFLIPLLMWLASVIAAWMGVERLVNRHIRDIGQAVTAFAAGDRRALAMADRRGAPLEVQELARAFDDMTMQVVRNEAELEDIVHQKEVLLREVHHRTKNNLQLIASIMNMHLRKAQSDEAQSVIRELRDRVMSIATIHRELYQTVGVTDVHSRQLLTGMCQQIAALFTEPGRRPELALEFDDLRLTPDQAVPLALLMAEILSNAIRHGTPVAGALPPIAVRFQHVGGHRARLVVANPVAAGRVEPAPEGIGRRLMQAFTTQLEGELCESLDEGRFTVTVEFPVRALQEAEERANATRQGA